MIIKTLYDFIKSAADYGLTLQRGDGSFPPGHNGPYLDEETPARNTGHWIIIFLKVYEITRDSKFLDAAQKAVNFLLSEKARPMNASFWHRKNPQKDFSNGLIGQAWSIEALMVAAPFFDDPRIVKVAQDVFLMHPFDERLGLWKKIGVDGSYLSIDVTFNHQLWFAAAGGLLKKCSENEEIGRRLDQFMDNLAKNFLLYPSGLIFHNLRRRSPLQMVKQFLRMFYRLNRKEIFQKAVGYHQFSLYAFALLKNSFPSHPFWGSKKFKTLWEYANTEKYRKEIGKSEFGYPYNPPGFEMSFALEVFGGATPDRREKQEKWITEQIRLCFDFDSGLITKGTKDPETYTARIYEATRLPDLKINI